MTQIKRLQKQRLRRRYRVRNKIKRSSTRPRLAVFRSSKHIYVQLIDDEAATCLISASTIEKTFRDEHGYGGNIKSADLVGTIVAERAIAAGIKEVVFDRREYQYHGRVAAVADAARRAGLVLGGTAPSLEKEKKEAKGGKGKKGGAKKGGDKKGGGKKAKADK